MAILSDELSRLGESIIIVLHDEATLLPVAQEDGKLRLGAMNHADFLNLSLIKSIMNKEQKIAHTGFGRNGERVANTPMRWFPPSLGGRTVGDQFSRTACENCQISQMWLYSSSPRKASALR